jgi:EAL domain-containing protein (putative c-di-GMP-specific phosphodiesterase class I)
MTLDLSPESLADALDQEAIQAWYQPRVSCSSRALVGFEVLARWPHPELGLIMPDQFIPLAERSGLIGRLAREVIEEALLWFAKPFGDSSVTITVNLSSTLLSDAELPDWLSECCARFAVNPAQVVLAITEADAMTNQVRIAPAAMRLRIHGFHFCITNFGVGYASLRLLAQLPFSELTLDRRFVTNASFSETSREIIANVIGLSRAVDLRVTADGVVDDGAFAYLQRKGCHAAQGDLIAPPMDGVVTLNWRTAYDRARLASRS